MSTSSTKARWRHDMRRRRREGAAGARPPAVEALTHSVEWRQARIIASYSPTGSEQRPTLIDAAARAAGKRLVYPRVVTMGEMVFKAPGADEDFVCDDCGIAAPNEQAETVHAAQIDLFIIPLLACDDDGVRLGYGGGYYDRQLALSEGFRCGLGFQLQRVASLPAESHDMCLQSFLSESGLEYF